MAPTEGQRPLLTESPSAPAVTPLAAHLVEAHVDRFLAARLVLPRQPAVLIVPPRLADRVGQGRRLERDVRGTA